MQEPTLSLVNSHTINHQTYPLLPLSHSASRNPSKSQSNHNQSHTTRRENRVTQPYFQSHSITPIRRRRHSRHITTLNNSSRHHDYDHTVTRYRFVWVRRRGRLSEICQYQIPYLEEFKGTCISCHRIHHPHGSTYIFRQRRRAVVRVDDRSRAVLRAFLGVVDDSTSRAGKVGRYGGDVSVIVVGTVVG